MKITKTIALAAFALIGLTACKNENEKDKEKEISIEKEEVITTDEQADKKEEDLVAVIGQSKQHTTLASALESAGLVAVLKSEGPYTIFAPTNEAFNKIPKEKLDELMQPEQKETLEGILSYHVVPGEISADKLTSLIQESGSGSYELVTANDGKLKASIKDNAVVLTDNTGTEIKVTDVDREGSNGYIHVIDGVLMRE